MIAASRKTMLATALGLVLMCGGRTWAADLPPAAEPEGELTLDDALSLVLRGSPRLAAFSFDLAARDAARVQAGTIPNPELDLRLQRLGAPEQSFDPDRERLRVILSQEFELGGKRRRRVELADSEHALAAAELASRQDEIAATLAADFMTLLGAQRRHDEIQRWVDFYGDLQDRVATLVKAGRVRNIDKEELARRHGLARIALGRA